MQDIMEIALKKVDKSLDTYPPYDIDERMAGGGFIVEFSTYNFNIQLLTAEIFDEDGETIPALSEELAEKVEQEITIRNREHKKDLQEIQLYPDFWSMY